MLYYYVLFILRPEKISANNIKTLCSIQSMYSLNLVDGDVLFYYTSVFEYKNSRAILS